MELSYLSSNIYNPLGQTALRNNKEDIRNYISKEIGKSGCIDACKLILNNIDNIDPYEYSYIDSMFYGIGLSGNINLLKMLNKKYDIYLYKIYTLYGAAKGGHTELYTHLIKEGIIDHISSCIMAVKGGKMNMLKLCLSAITVSDTRKIQIANYLLYISKLKYDDIYLTEISNILKRYNYI